jgi:hypothetical protein
VVGAPLVYDAARDRLLVLQSGCNVALDGGGAGAVAQRGVEEVDLATGQVKTLLQLNDKGFPSSLVFVDGTRAAVTFLYPNEAYFWNPSQSVIGPKITAPIESASHDGKGNLIGALRTSIDGGATISVLSVPFPGDGGAVDAASVQTLGENPFTANGGFLGGAEVWPRP